MSAPAKAPLTDRPARRRLRRALWQSLAALLITAGLVAALDAGTRMLGPVLIVVAALSGVRGVRAWWLDLDERWFAAEIVLVTAGWALFAAAFAGIQYLSFSLIPEAFFVEADYGRLVSPRYRAEWLRDSTRVGATLIGVAMPLTSWLLGIVGGVLFLVGAGIGLAYGIMEHTEDYELRPREPDPSSDEPGDQHARRIISA